ncbi:MAG: transglutaminase-like domain-containing protein [Patescibacteria group bacterium]
MLGIIQSLKEKLGLAYYLYPQTYQVSLETVLTNTTATTKDFSLVLPLPIDGPSQKILEGPEMFPQPVSVKADPLYGNRYVVFSGNAGPKESFIFKTNFKVAVLPRQIQPTQTFTLSDYSMIDRDLFNRWTGTSPHIDTRDPRIPALTNEAKKRGSDIATILRNINEYVIGRLRYGNAIPGLYSSHEALEKEMVDCGGFDTLFIALVRAIGIPARLVGGFWAGYQTNAMHAWVEVLLPDGQWMPVDPSTEQLARNGRTAKGGRLGFSGSNRIIFSYGADIPIEVNDKKTSFPILQNPTLAFSEMNSFFSLTLNLQTKRL